MRKERTLFILGIWVALLSFLGFPNSWRKGLFIITGIALVYLAYLYYIEAKIRIAKASGDREKSFVESRVEEVIYETKEE